MNRQASTNIRRQTARHAQNRQTVCVVDPRVDDYGSWRATAAANDVGLKFVATLDNALKVSRTEKVDLWVINTALPGGAGAELCSMLRAAGNRGAVYLVADEYSPDAERAAWDSRATAFICKPMHHDALAGWLERARGVPPAHSIFGPASITQ